MSAAFLFIGLMAGGLALILNLIQKSPVGYQDGSGFHFGYPSNSAQQDDICFGVVFREQVQDSETIRNPIENEVLNPLVILKFPWLARGFVFAILLVTLVIFPRTVKNAGSYAQLNLKAPFKDQRVNPSVGGSEEKQSEPTSGINTGMGTRLLPQLCVRFSEVE